MSFCTKCGYYSGNGQGHCDLCGLHKKYETTDIDPGFFRFTCVDCGAWVPHKRIKSDKCDDCNEEFENVCLCCTRLFKVKGKDVFVGVCPDCKKELAKKSNPVQPSITTEAYVVVSEYGDICTHTLRPTQDECEAAAISVWGKMWWEGMKKNGAVIKPCVISV